MSDTIYEVLVVGGGIGGSAAALRAAQYNLSTAWIRGTKKTAKASRGLYVYNIDNMIGVHPDLMLEKVNEALDGPEFEAARAKLAEQDWHIGTLEISDNVLTRIRDEHATWVEVIDEKAVEAGRDGELFTLKLEDGRVLRGRNLVLSTGVMDRQPSIKKELKSGKVLDDPRWIYPYANYERLLYCIRCEGHLTRDTRTSIIGVGEGAAQLAMMLHERYGTKVTILTNGAELGAESDSVKLLEHYGIRVETTRIVDLYDVAEGAEESGKKVKKGTELHGFVLEDGKRVDARYGLIALGLFKVYNDLARQLGAELEGGDKPREEQHVLVEDHSSETNVRGLFTVGDMSKRRDGGPLMKQVYTAQEYAVRAIDTVDRRRRSAQRAALLERS
ncbi:MAG: NAD(P)/FAD-dependent oxidoreductase [Planctomycetes bacterium]|nr:NAD(P)/FAD-dependent oxidoreductase [Planctomycetota bacterium]MCB9905070.1 NAD(P)/FAD-dependent oxidoreductase [Planctomycetota bacterium]